MAGAWKCTISSAKATGHVGLRPPVIPPITFPRCIIPRRASRARALHFAEAQQKQGQEAGLDTPHQALQEADAPGPPQEGGIGAHAVLEGGRQQPPSPGPDSPLDAAMAAQSVDGSGPAVAFRSGGGGGAPAAAGGSGDVGGSDDALRGGAAAAVCAHAACSAQRFCFLSELQRVRQSYLDGGRTDQFKKKAIDKAIKRVWGGGGGLGALGEGGMGE